MIDPEKVKADSIATLRSWGVSVIDHLPQLEAEADLSPQSALSVARRCMIMRENEGEQGAAGRAMGLLCRPWFA